VRRERLREEGEKSEKREVEGGVEERKRGEKEGKVEGEEEES
jgi:hypothetical protein